MGISGWEEHGLSPPLLDPAAAAFYTGGMCKPIRDYLGLMRDYTREMVTFGGICLMCVVYTDFKQLARDQAATSAATLEVLRSLDNRLIALEQQSHRP